jgi:hypothetical protein
VPGQALACVGERQAEERLHHHDGAGVHDDGVDLLEGGIAAERRVEDGVRQAGDDERQDRHQNQLEDGGEVA